MHKQIFIHDRQITSGSNIKTQDYFAHAVRWSYGWPQGTEDPFSHWNIDFLGASLKSQDNIESQLLENLSYAAIAQLWNSLKAGPMFGHYLLRCYANAHTYGVEGYPHTDIVDASQVDNYTAVVYLNPVWKKQWAGELVLFNPDGDTVAAVLPKSGRVAMIPGDMVHAARGVSRQCPAVRICIAFKTRIPQPHELGYGEIGAPEQMMHLWVDPASQRVAYASLMPDAPTRIHVLEGERLGIERVFVPAQLQKAQLPVGSLPKGFYAQKSWGFVLRGGAVVSAA